MTRSLDVLHVITTMDRGGAENHLMEVVRHQVAQGRRVGVAWLKGNYWEAELGKLGVVVVPIRSRFYGDLASLWRLRLAINTTQPRLVHAHMGPAELYARLVLATVRCRPSFVISKHNDAAIFAGPFANAVEHWIARRAAAVVCISEAVARRMREGGAAIPADKVHVVRYGIDTSRFRSSSVTEPAALRLEWNKGCAGTVVFGCAARLVPQKDHDTLFKAAAEIRREVGPEAFRLVLIGRGPEEPRLRVLADQLGIADAVVFAGFREDMPTVMEAIDVLCLSSRHEGFGLVLIEGMAAQKPVVATRVSSIPEIVVPEETGCLVNAGDVSGFAAAMRRMMDPGVRDSFGGRGFARVTSEFTTEAMNRRLDILYGRILPGWST